MNIEDLNEELLGLKFEIKTLRGFLFEKSFERWLPGFAPKSLHDHHKIRYDLACKYVQNKIVLDMACGSGYGSYLLAENGKAAKVVGVDIDAEAVQYGNFKFPSKNVTRIYGNAQEFTNGQLFDVAVSFETIEHLPEYGKFIECVKKALKTDGQFIISTPIVMKTTKTCDNPYHVIEWSFSDFQKLISEYFTIEETFVQNIKLFTKKSSNTIFARVFRKIKNTIIPIKENSKGNEESFEKWDNQYIPENIVWGYQIVICKNNKKSN